MQYPKVQKYCLMSVRGCYTDFHVDFGGTSVWYHILRGGKVFWLIPPTTHNLEMYENWLLSGKQGDIFLGDRVAECQRIELQQGYTFVIPSGWIHAVFTPVDTLVFGGNFLHSFNIPMQLRIYSIEDRTRVPNKFRYPFYYEMCWYVLERYVYCMTSRSHLTKEYQRESLSIDLELNKAEYRKNDEDSEEEEDEEEEEEEDDDDEDYEETCKRSRSRRCLFSNPMSNGAHRYEMPRSYRSVPLPRPPSLKRTPSIEFSDSGASYRSHMDLDLFSQHSGLRKEVPITFLTRFEQEGLRSLVDKLESLPLHKKCVPTGIEDEEALLADVKKLLEEHANDPPKLALTGVPIVQWPKRDKYKVQWRPKIRTPIIPITKPHTMRPAPRQHPPVKPSTPQVVSGARRRRVRCRKCTACTQRECGVCHYCKDMKKFGGPGRMKQSCVLRQCLAPRLPHSVICALCGDTENDETQDFQKKLMECSLCNEIVHPGCLQMDGAGLLNEELPNCWECPKCYQDDNSDKVSIKMEEERMLLQTKRKMEESEEEQVQAKVLRPLRSREEPLACPPQSPTCRLQLIHDPGSPPPSARSTGTRSSPGAGPSHIPSGNRDERFKRRQLLRIQAGDLGMQLAQEKENNPSGKELSEIERAKIRGNYLTVTLQRPPKDFQSTSIVPKLQAITESSSNLRQAPRVVTHHSTHKAHTHGRTEEEEDGDDEEEEEEEEDDDDDDSTEECISNGSRVHGHSRTASYREQDGEDFVMQRDVWMSVFRYLSRKELCECMRVCKTWYKWCCDKRLWTKIDLSRRKSVVPQALSGIIKRQPVSLDLSWTNISKKQLTWLVNRLPGLKDLILAGCSWSAVSALSTSSCPLLRTLDLRWAVGIKDPQIRDLLTPSTEKPGHDNRSKLRNMTDFRLAGLDITDATLRLIIRHMPLLSRLDISHCCHLTDQSVNLLTAVGSSTRNSLTELNLAGCNKLTDQCLLYLRRIANVNLIDLRGCKQITRGACEQFISDLSINSLYCLSDEKLLQKIS
ncbi:lysine-specific demethylase 2A isoform X2 [Microcaecilia unicolor]|nr:lysine-specific demethylase 2A isoform X2 [Microcaecilia unicolor]